jgi:uncharacterized membrane protein
MICLYVNTTTRGSSGASLARCRRRRYFRRRPTITKGGTMNTATLVLRLLHIICGVYWAGTLMFLATLLQPSVAEAGPDGARVTQALMRRRFLEIIPVMAILTILTGIELYRRASGNFSMDWISSGPGMSLTIGGIAALVAFTIGMSTLRPAAKRAGPLAQKAQGLPEGAEREALMAEVQRLRRRMAVGGRVVASLLLVAVVGMAAFRYV